MYLYQQIASKIQETIQNKNHSDKLDDERTLASYYDVSRSTIRKALALLKDQGHLSIKQGSGIFVQDKCLIQDINSGYYGLTSDMHSIGKDIDTVVINAELINTPNDKQYEAFSDLKLVKIERIRIFNGVKSIYEVSFLPSSRFPSLEKIIKNNLSLYETLQNLYQVAFSHGDEILSAGLIDEKTAAILDTGKNTCIVNIISNVYEEDQLIEYSEAYILSDVFKWKYAVNVKLNPHSYITRSRSETA